ncbi:MAG: TIM44-like domain-containing protein [Pirellulales bacterium]
MKQLHRNFSRILLLVGLLTIIMMVFFPEFCWARAGSGGSYSGGGSGGSGSGGGGGDVIGILIWLAFRHPVIGVPLLILFLAVTIYGKIYGQEQYQERYIRKAHEKQDDFSLQQGLSAIAEHDPNFAIDKFCQRASQGFLNVQDAWSNQHLTPIRPFVSDGIYERFSLQIEEQQELGYRNIMEKVRVINATPLEILSNRNKENSFEVISVQIQAKAIDYRVSRDAGKEIGGSRRSNSFTEVWTFIRRSNAKTPNESRGLIEGDCPNCGQSISLSTSEKCESCDSLLRSGEHDWVLSEITQADAYRPHRLEGMSSAAAYWIQHDPSFNTHHLEDRASVIFWRKVMADRKRDIAPLNKMAADQFCDAYELQLKQTNSDRAATYGDCGVGSVELIGVIPNEKMDRALVSIRWSGKRWKPNGQLTERGYTFRSLLVLGRNQGVKTKIDQSISSSHCFACGAPEENLTSHACEFCGEVLNNGSQDWVLLEFLPFSGEIARSLIKQANEGLNTAATVFSGKFDEDGIYTAPFMVTNQTVQRVSAEALDGVTVNGNAPSGINLIDDVSLIAWVVSVAAADGELDEKEKALLKNVATNHGVSHQKLQQMLHSAGRGELAMPQAANKKTAKHWLQTMVDMALIDGKLDQSEKKLLSQTGQRVGLTAYDMKQLVRKRRAALYRDSKQILKNNRASAV